MFKRSKKFMSLFVACSMLLSIFGGAVDAAVATLLSPKPGDATGKIVDVSVKYDSQSQVKIDTVILYVDNAVYEKKKLPVPAKKGVVSFDWNTQSYAKGQHYIEVKLFANGKLVTAVNGAGVVSDTVFDVVAPKVALENVVNGEEVSGTKTIRISAKDDSGQAPIVSLLVDKKLKLMQNTQPYAYNLDTTAMTDGKHVIEVYAFDFEGNQSDIVSYTINVNNGGTQVAEVPVVVNDNTVKESVVKENKEQKLATRPALNKNTNTQVGRVSEKDLNASVSVINTNPLVSTGGVLTSPTIQEETTKIVVKDPVVTKVAVNPVSNNTTNLKLTTSLKTSELSLNAPKVTSEAVVKEPTTVLITKRISDNSVVANELKLVTGTKNSELTLNAPSVSPAVNEPTKVTVKDTEKVLVAKSTSYNNTNSANLKLTSNSANPSVNINEPTMVKTEVKVVAKENLDTPKTEAKVGTPKAAPKDKAKGEPKGKAKDKPKSEPKAEPKTVAQANVTPATENIDTPKAEVKCDNNCPKPECKAEVKCDKNCPKAECKKETKCNQPCPKTCNKTGKAKLRDIVNAQNGTLFWDNKTKTVTAYVNNCKVEMKIGSKKVKVNGNPLTINLVPQLKNGRTIIDVTEFKKLTAPCLKD